MFFMLQLYRDYDVAFKEMEKQKNRNNKSQHGYLLEEIKIFINYKQ